MTAQKIKRGDTARRFTDTLTVDGDAMDLTGCEVSFFMRDLKTGQLRGGDAEIVTATAGTVSYQPSADDVGTVGVFKCEWQITYTGGKKQTVPEDSFIKIEVLQDVA